MFKKIGGVIMALVMIMNLCIISFAYVSENDDIKPYYSYTASVRTLLNISNGNATCSARLTGMSGTTTKIKITMTLEKKVLFWWSEQETWTQTFNSYTGTLSKNYSGANSGTYRVSAEYIAYSGTNSETITDTSAEVKA